MTWRYSAYQDSGVEWVGEIPVGWTTLPAYAVGFERNEPNTGMKEDNLLSLSYGRIVPKDIEALDGLLPESFETYQIIHPGDVVLRLTDLQNDKRSLRSAIVTERGIITSAYVAFVPSKIDSRYLSYLLRDYDLRKVFYSMGGGLRQGMKYADIRRLPLIVPPVPEQTAIAAFLDRETAKIDVLVEEQRRLIGLLREKRQAVISHAVTRGLNPGAKLKPSGVDWLGDVPDGWEVVQLRRAIKAFEQGYSPECFAYPAAPGDWGVLKSGCVNRGIYREEENKALPPEVEPRPQWEVREGDLLMSRASGSPELIGSVAVVEATQGRIMMSDKIFRLRLEPLLRADFAYWMFASGGLRTQIVNAISGGDGMANNLPQSSIKEFVTTLPPEPEQAEIAAFLHDEVVKLDQLADIADVVITMLQERRAALISAAVTGKIDVRDLVPQETEAA